MVNGEMRPSGISQELELKGSATHCLDLKTTPDPPGGSALGNIHHLYFVMALIICHECGGRVSSEAVACPQCGAPPQKPPLPQPSLPPVISAPPPAVVISEPVRQEILKLARVGFGQIIFWTLFILGLASASIHGGRQPNPVASLLTFVFGIIVLRSWCKRRTMRTMLKRGSFRGIYWRAVWSYLWRSSCIAIGVSLLFGFAQDTATEEVASFMLALALWLILSLLALDVPFWRCRMVQEIVKKDSTKTVSPNHQRIGKD